MKKFFKKVASFIFKLLNNIIKLFGKLSKFIAIKACKADFKNIGKNFHIGKGFRFKNVDCIEIGDNFVAGEHLVLESWKEYKTVKFNPNLKIGNNVTFTDNIQISCANEICIGDNVLFGSGVFLSDNSHGNNVDIDICPAERPLYSKGAIFIGNNVWLGRNVVVLSNVTVGDNCIIGANSVVTKDIPSNSVAVGAPAKVIKTLI